jgi:hypothetical protein
MVQIFLSRKDKVVMRSRCVLVVFLAYVSLGAGYGYWTDHMMINGDANYSVNIAVVKEDVVEVAAEGDEIKEKKKNDKAFADKSIQGKEEEQDLIELPTSEMEVSDLQDTTKDDLRDSELENEDLSDASTENKDALNNESDNTVDGNPTEEEIVLEEDVQLPSQEPEETSNTTMEEPAEQINENPTQTEDTTVDSVTADNSEQPEEILESPETDISDDAQPQEEPVNPVDMDTSEEDNAGLGNQESLTADEPLPDTTD